MERFAAQVQYGDWQGTSAADNADMNDMSKLLRDRGLLHPGQMLVGVRAFIGENHNGKVRDPYIEALIAEGGTFDEIRGVLAATPDPLKLKRVRLDLSITEFFGLFKRVDIVFAHRGLNLSDREYEAHD